MPLSRDGRKRLTLLDPNQPSLPTYFLGGNLEHAQRGRTSEHPDCYGHRHAADRRGTRRLGRSRSGGPRFLYDSTRSPVSDLFAPDSKATTDCARFPRLLSKIENCNDTWSKRSYGRGYGRFAAASCNIFVRELHPYNTSIRESRKTQQRCCNTDRNSRQPSTNISEVVTKPRHEACVDLSSSCTPCTFWCVAHLV